MRTIKFRAWDKKKNKMCYDVSISGALGGYWSDNLIKDEWHEEGLMQFTGLKDKNGKEIYEGEIVKNRRTRKNYEVVWSEGHYEIRLRSKRNSTYIAIPIWYKLEVVGNKFENPELLKNE